MYPLHLDDAGAVNNMSDKRFIPFGIAIFERQVHWLQAEIGYDERLHGEYQLVECFTNKMKHYRRAYMRYGELAQRYPGIVRSLIWMR